MRVAPEGPGRTPIPRAGRTTMWADTTQLYASAYAWEWDIYTELGYAERVARDGASATPAFGLALAAVARAHEEFMTLAHQLLCDATVNAGAMGHALRLAADAYDRSDDDAAANVGRVRSAR